MKIITKYVSDNWVEFDTSTECKIYEVHIKNIEAQLSTIPLWNKGDILNAVLEVFKKDEKFKWVESYWYNEHTFGRAIDDCTNNYHIPYLKYYNFIF